MACGALGRYERQRVERIARALAPEMQSVHEGGNAMLMLDRPTLRWSGRRAEGLAWSERIDAVAGGAFESWRDTATAGSACGLVLEGRRPRVHSTVSGVSSIYYLEAGGAVYFCSRIDPLLAAVDGLLTADWEAWAAFLALGNPVGNRTPFAEVKRLPPFSTLECRRGRARVREERWPWAEIEPHDRLEEAAYQALEEMRVAVARLPEGPVACPLSGGWDSRMLLGLLAEQRHPDAFALTASNDDGTDQEERFATAVAHRLRVPHECIAGEPDTWWDDMRWFALRTDYQVALNPWLVPLIPRIQATEATVTDGLGVGVLAQPANRFAAQAAAELGGGPRAPHALWDSLITHRAPPPYRPRVTRALHAGAWHQLLAESERHAGHPSRILLTYWRTRVARCVAPNPDAVLGAALPIATPFVEDAVARALLSASPKVKLGSRMHKLLLAALDPALRDLPSTNDEGLPVEPRNLATRRRSPMAARGFAELLLDSPLTPFLDRQALRHLTRDERGRATRVPAGGLPPAIFTLWHRRYESRLRPLDVADLLA